MGMGIVGQVQVPTQNLYVSLLKGGRDSGVWYLHLLIRHMLLTMSGNSHGSSSSLSQQMSLLLCMWKYYQGDKNRCLMQSSCLSVLSDTFNIFLTNTLYWRDLILFRLKSDCILWWCKPGNQMKNRLSVKCHLLFTAIIIAWQLVVT